MRLLIVTQTVDTKDPVLGFFVRWIEEFAKHVERIEVICLKEGKHSLPKNVRVHSLGKEKGVSRATYIFNFYRYIWNLRHDYDAVFVHMNPEYVILGGLLWRLWSKRIALWYTHKSVNARLRLATLLADVIFTASKESFRFLTKKLHVMGHGIDVDFFSPSENMSRGTAVLSAGRLSPTKRHDLVIQSAEYFPNEVRIVGEGPEKQHLETLAANLSLGSRVHFLGAHTQEELREEYRRAGVFVHVSETGSLDKVVLEALACGLPVVTTSATLGELPVTVVLATPNAIAEGVLAARSNDIKFLTTYVREHHSLQRLIPAILEAIQVP
jgi:glycosyltransferase involved in cell wall biosynthesis